MILNLRICCFRFVNVYNLLHLYIISWYLLRLLFCLLSLSCFSLAPCQCSYSYCFAFILNLFRTPYSFLPLWLHYDHLKPLLIYILKNGIFFSNYKPFYIFDVSSYFTFVLSINKVLLIKIIHWHWIYKYLT